MADWLWNGSISYAPMVAAKAKALGPLDLEPAPNAAADDETCQYRDMLMDASPGVRRERRHDRAEA